MRESTIVSIIALVAYFGGINWLAEKDVPLWFMVLVAVFGALFGMVCVITALGYDVQAREAKKDE